MILKFTLRAVVAIAVLAGAGTWVMQGPHLHLAKAMSQLVGVEHLLDSDLETTLSNLKSLAIQ
jgi:hypothetical protein